MKTTLSRRQILAGLAAGAATLPAGAWASAPDSSIRPALRPEDLGKVQPSEGVGAKLVAQTRTTGSTSWAVADLKSGRILDSGNDAIPHPPASTAKTLSSIYALEFLGPDHKFRTSVASTGTLNGGRLEGDLVLVGGGDPSLDTVALADLVMRVQAAGVTEVTGDFLYYAGALPILTHIDSEQPVFESYNPGISGLNLNFNRVHFSWEKKGGHYEVQMDARAGRYVPVVDCAVMEVVDHASDDAIYGYEDKGGRDNWTVTRAALSDSGARWLPVRRPAEYSAEVFRSLASDFGLKLKVPRRADAMPAHAWPLAHVESRELSYILTKMLYYSTNVTAEIVGLSASNARGLAPASLEDSASAMSAWAKETLGLQDAALVDHSGLEGANRITSRDMVHMLCSSRASDGLRPLLKRIPSGRGVDMKIHAKTGTLNFVSCLAGYIAVDDGRDLVFSVMSGDVDRRNALPMREREHPPGGHTWLNRARYLQHRLMETWAKNFGKGPLPT